MGQVVGYARLSTAEQASGQTLQQQIQRLETAGADEVLVDLMPGTSTGRPKYRELLSRIEKGLVAKVVATRWDRLSRSSAETCRLVDLFSADGAPALELLDDPLDLSTVGGRLQLRLLGAIAEAEVERLRERSMAGKRHRKAKGGADVAPFGMRVRGDGLLEPDQEKFLCSLETREELSRADVARELFSVIEVKGPYAGWTAAWERFGLRFDRAGISRWALNPSLRGARVRGRIKNRGQDCWDEVHEAANEALIAPERHLRFEAATRGRKARGQRNDTRRQHPLSSKLFCAHCGRRLVRKLVTRGQPRYSCAALQCSYRIPGTRANSISESAAMEAVCKSLFLAADRIADAIEGRVEGADQQELQDQLLALRQRRATYEQMYADGALELQGAIEQLDRQIADAAVAAVAPKAGDPTLELFRRQMREGMSSVRTEGLPLQELSPAWDADNNIGAAWVATVCWLGAEAWLDPEHRQTATRWIDRWVHSVSVESKSAKAQLNL